MRRTPRAVALVARTHWTVGAAIVVTASLLLVVTRNLPRIEFGPKTYLITGALALLYLLAGTLVWFGAPFGQLLSRVCGLLYLPRPQFGGYLWDLMSSAEFREHFERKKRVEEPTKHTNDAKEG